jgi:alpha-D-xyloside xylohydrolase
MGFWQCKLRYQTQEELLEHRPRIQKKRTADFDVIVIDFFPLAARRANGNSIPKYWPDPDAMVRELREMGIELMVSIWPTVDYAPAKTSARCWTEGLSDKHASADTRIGLRCYNDTLHFDATNPEARAIRVV